MSTQNPVYDISNSIIHNSQKMETTQMSINWGEWKNKLCCIHTILFGYKRNEIYTTTWITSENVLSDTFTIISFM